MLFWLKKAVSYWLMPLPFCTVLILVGGILVWGSTRWRRMGRVALILGIVLLILSSNRQVGAALLRPLESQFSPIPELPVGQPLPASLSACRAIVVLGSGHSDMAGVSSTDQLSTAGLSRLVEGVRLARSLPNVPLIVSGPAENGGATHASVLAAAAISLGIDPQRIQQIDTARDTDDETQALVRLLGPHAKFALVTSAFHMPRSVGLMRRAGLDPLPCPTGFLVRTNSGSAGTDWWVSIPALELSSWAIYERLGMTWAKLQGKI